MNAPARPLPAALLAAVLIALAPAAPALAWGSAGHHLISRAGMEGLPPSMPAFLLTHDAALTVEALGTEPDRLKGAGDEFRADNDPGHYLDLGDDDTIGTTVALDALPSSRLAYDTALRATGTSQYQMGFLPYSLIDGWERVAYDLAVWRTDRVGAAKAASAEDRAAFAADVPRREALVIHDIGYWSHFVGDASQPLHVTTHFNGWGDGPNPEGFTNAKSTHAHFEGEFVRENATLALVEHAMTPAHVCACDVRAHVASYLRATNGHVLPFYRLEKQGAFATPTVTGVAFTIARLADGASALRDFVMEAYDASAMTKVGYPEAHTAADYEAGRAVPSRTAVLGSD